MNNAFKQRRLLLVILAVYVWFIDLEGIRNRLEVFSCHPPFTVEHVFLNSLGALDLLRIARGVTGLPRQPLWAREFVAISWILKMEPKTKVSSTPHSLGQMALLNRPATP